MTEVLFTDVQFFGVIMTVIWLYISTLGYERDDVILLYIQFFIQLPLSIMLLANAFLQGLTVGYGLAFGILTASCYFVFLGTALSNRQK